MSAEITPVNEIQPLQVVPETIYDPVKIASERAKILELARNAAIKLTSPYDWVDMGGKPYLDSNGAEKIARLYGIKWHCEKPEKEWMDADDKGQHYCYNIYGWVGFNELESITEIGTCSTRDKFFGRKNSEQLPVSEIDEQNIKKKAIANFVARAVTRFLGFGGMTWDQLYETAPKLKGQIASVSYGSSKGQSRDADAKPEGSNLSFAEMRLQLGNMLLEIFTGDKEAASQKLQELTSFTKKDGTGFQGYKSANAVSDNMTTKTYDKVKAFYKETFGKEYGESSPTPVVSDQEGGQA